ncbi:MAG: hypothetical protein L0K86_08725 [Actinomycetia bacterium]|nr:hypothetical protein [Actinomycetes bacterium]
MTAMPQQTTTEAATDTTTEGAATATTTAELPIYQGLLDESDQATRETVIAQQGEGHAPSSDTTDSDDPLGRHR